MRKGFPTPGHSRHVFCFRLTRMINGPTGAAPAHGNGHRMCVGVPHILPACEETATGPASLGVLLLFSARLFLAGMPPGPSACHRNQAREREEIGNAPVTARAIPVSGGPVEQELARRRARPVLVGPAYAAARRKVVGTEAPATPEPFFPPHPQKNVAPAGPIALFVCSPLSGLPLPASRSSDGLENLDNQSRGTGFAC